MHLSLGHVCIFDRMRTHMHVRPCVDLRFTLGYGISNKLSMYLKTPVVFEEIGSPLLPPGANTAIVLSPTSINSNRVTTLHVTIILIIPFCLKLLPPFYTNNRVHRIGETEVTRQIMKSGQHSPLPPSDTLTLLPTTLVGHPPSR